MSHSLCVSAIGWKPFQDGEVATIFREFEIGQIECVPSRVACVTDESWESKCRSHRNFWEHQRITICAAQALLYGRDGLQLFGDDTMRAELFECLAGVLRVGSLLGAKSFTFGAPKVRQRGSMDYADAYRVAREFFRLVGREASALNSRILIEPNPQAYDCDFLTATVDAVTFVEAVDEPGCALQLDGGTMIINREDPREVIKRAGSLIGHFHASEPHLAPLTETNAKHHRLFSALLYECNYAGSVSLEMKSIDSEINGGASFSTLRRSLTNLKDYYR